MFYYRRSIVTFDFTVHETRNQNPQQDQIAVSHHEIRLVFIQNIRLTANHYSSYYVKIKKYRRGRV